MKLLKLLSLWFLKLGVLLLAVIGSAIWGIDLIEYYKGLENNTMQLLVFIALSAFYVGLMKLYIMGDDRLWKEIEKEANRMLTMEKYRDE